MPQAKSNEIPWNTSGLGKIEKEKKMDEMKLASLEGKVVGFCRNNILAIVKTEEGLAYLDINDTWLPEIKVGDKVETGFCPFYISNGKIITNPTEFLVVNGIQFCCNPTK